MKAFSIIFVLVLSLHLQTFAQDEPAYLNKSWKSLVSQIQRRNDVATVLLIKLNETNTMDSTTLQKARGVVKAFTFYLREQMTRFDSSTVKRVYEMNQSTNAAMGSVLSRMENAPNLKQISDVSALLLHLEGTEKRLQTYMQQHNEFASTSNRSDLAFTKN